MRAETHAYTYSKVDCTAAVSLFHYRPTSQGTSKPNHITIQILTFYSPSLIRLKLPTTAKMAGVDYKPFDFRLFVEVEGEKLDDTEAANKAADDAAAEELRAAEEEAAALPEAERAARFLELARRAEEEAAAEVAGDDPSAVDKKAAEDAATEQQKEGEEEAAGLPSEEAKEAKADAELKVKGDAPDAPPLAAVNKFAVLRKANEEDARLKAVALSAGLSENLLNGGKEIKSKFICDAGLSAQYALNTYAVAQAFYENTGEWEEADDKMLPFLHIQVELIYARKRQREDSEQAAEGERAAKVPKN
ncbi:hypothetical protein ACLOAV_007428 [Pseudogymnoascus australis]